MKQILTRPNSNATIQRIRLRIEIPPSYLDIPVLSHLTTEYQLTFNIVGAKLMPGQNQPGQFDLELQGAIPQLQAGLSYLASLQISIRGKSSINGDSWHY